MDGVDLERGEAKASFIENKEGCCAGRAVKNLTYISLTGAFVLSFAVLFYPDAFSPLFLRAISGVAGAVFALSIVRICYLENFTTGKQVLSLRKQVNALDGENKNLQQSLINLQAVSPKYRSQEIQIKALLKYSEIKAAELSRLNKSLLLREEQIEQLALNKEELKAQLGLLKRSLEVLKEENENLKQHNEYFANEEKEFDKDVDRLVEEKGGLRVTREAIKEQVKEMTSLVKVSADLKKTLAEMTENPEEEDEVTALLKRVLDRVTQDP